MYKQITKTFVVEIKYMNELEEQKSLIIKQKILYTSNPYM